VAPTQTPGQARDPLTRAQVGSGDGVDLIAGQPPPLDERVQPPPLRLVRGHVGAAYPWLERRRDGRGAIVAEVVIGEAVILGMPRARPSGRVLAVAIDLGIPLTMEPSGLDDQTAAMASRYLNRLPQLTPGAHAELGERIPAAVRAQAGEWTGAAWEGKGPQPVQHAQPDEPAPPPEPAGAPAVGTGFVPPQ
jgi:hypothetical protein